MVQRKRLFQALLICIALGAGAVTAGCSDDDAAGPDDTPDNHTVLRSGVAHGVGLNDPMQNCTACHGADLRGGAQGEPSCFSCHGQKWP